MKRISYSQLSMYSNLFKLKLLSKQARLFTNEHGVRKMLLLLISRIAKITLVIVSLPMVPLLRISNRIYPIKLVEIRTKEIGHFVVDTEYYLRRTSLKRNPVFLLGYFGEVISNKQWARMVKRHFLVNDCFRFFAIANRLFSGAHRYEYFKDKYESTLCYVGSDGDKTKFFQLLEFKD